MTASIPLSTIRVRGGHALTSERVVAEEVAIAIVHDAATYAVMMATPTDLEDFAVGFSLTEGVISSTDEVRAFEISESELGIEARLWLHPGRAAALAGRRRMLAGPTGCGLCGIDSLELAARIAPAVLADVAVLAPAQIQAAMAALEPAQILGQQTRAVHAAGLWRPNDGLVLAREDVGRHNAVDKLAGAMARGTQSAAGVLLLTSRVSVELVQKAAAMGVPVIAAVSAPTHLAIKTAQAAGITLLAVVRTDGFEVFTHQYRIAL